MAFIGTPSYHNPFGGQINCFKVRTAPVYEDENGNSHIPSELCHVVAASQDYALCYSKARILVFEWGKLLHTKLEEWGRERYATPLWVFRVAFDDKDPVYRNARVVLVDIIRNRYGVVLVQANDYGLSIAFQVRIYDL